MKTEISKGIGADRSSHRERRESMPARPGKYELGENNLAVKNFFGFGVKLSEMSIV
jgi:hypothetical protein